MLTELTRGQQDLMLVVRDEWMSKIFDPKKRLKLNKAKARKQIRWLYKQSSLKAPKHVIFVESPLGMQMAVWLLKNSKQKPGDSVGASVRDSVGASVGASVWASVWASVGDSVRASVGDSVRASVGDSVRASVWASVWASVRASVGASVRDSVGASVRASVWASVRASVGASVRDSVWDSVGASVGDSVRASVGDSVRASVWASVRDSVGAYTSPTYYGNVGDYGWCAFFDYFKRIGVLKHDPFDKFMDLLDAGIYDMLVMENVAIVCPMPTAIHRTDVRGQMRLHKEDGFAIEWPDGYGINYLWGVFFPDNIWQKTLKANLKYILSMENMEQKMAALKLHGPEMLVNSAGAVLIEESKRGNALYVIPKEVKVFDENEYFIKYKCPSTGRVYVKPVAPDVGAKHDADYAQASTFQVACLDDAGKLAFRAWTKEEYAALSIES